MAAGIALGFAEQHVQCVGLLPVAREHVGELHVGLRPVVDPLAGKPLVEAAALGEPAALDVRGSEAVVDDRRRRVNPREVDVQSAALRVAQVHPT